MTITEAYKTAMDVQDACNLSGVVRTWAEVTAVIWEDIREKGGGTKAFNSHPINVLFASKVESLTACSDSNVFTKAYEKVYLP